MRKKSWSSRDGVSPVIGTILLVGITVVLAATIYVMAFGLSGGHTNVPPVAGLTVSTAGNGFRFSFTDFSRDTTWGEITIVLTDGNNESTFANITTADLVSSDGTVTKNFGDRPLGSLSVFLNATDMTGNGHLNMGDSFTLTTSGGEFANNVLYEVYVVYDPSGSRIVSKTFQGS